MVWFKIFTNVRCEMGYNEIRISKYKQKNWTNLENFLDAIIARKNIDEKLSLL